ncbi:hypothetical protein [Bacillus sp. 165]|uniref:hypothetical protein n=1 Tax=Bacillus sp. 165 TaxID=1529117 RepID=UPI001ADD357B|nr:hypothetical protein [Bacillus sp. 165]MBO9130888.1 hypothetical protein [Bacillus sp. 165]
MGAFIRKFIIINNYGNVNIYGNCPVGSSGAIEVSKSNNGATGPVIADFVNGKRVQHQQATGQTPQKLVQPSEDPVDQNLDSDD